MEKLELLLDNYDGKDMDGSLISNYENFGYENDAIFQHHLKFMLENCYDIRIVEKKRKRLSQTEFREQLLERYNGKCVVSGNDCTIELTAAHIVPISIEETYDIDNGLILTETLHKTFDKYLWSIEPETQKIVICKDKNVGQIKKYVGMKINITMNPTLKNNITSHYNQFIISSGLTRTNK